MVSDSIANVSLSSSAPTSRDFCKKKRANRCAKLKQCKREARREQWLSQGAVKEKELKEAINVQGMSIGGREKTKNVTLGNLLSVGRGNESEGGGSINHQSDSESTFNSPTSSLLGGTDSGTNFTGSSSSGSSSSIGSFTEEGEDECLDDWEAVADALGVTGNQEIVSEPTNNPAFDQSNSNAASNSSIKMGLCIETSKVESSRAWCPDDAFRPQSLPNLSKQGSFPSTDQGGIALHGPSSCPICYEDLDLTDSSFLPCLCGFRLCLFCHNRIIEEDGRCPGCRKPYEAETGQDKQKYCLGRSYSMTA